MKLRRAVALGLLVLAPRLALGAERGILRYVPADAWLVVHYDGTHPGVRDTPLHAFFQEPEVKAAIEQLRPLYTWAVAEMNKEGEADADAVLRLLGGCEFVFAAMPPRGDNGEPGAMLAVNVGAGDSPARRLAEDVLKQALAKAKPGSARQVQIGQLRATCYADKKGEPSASVFDGPFLVNADGEEALRKALDPAAPKAPAPAGAERAALRVRYDHQAMLKAFGDRMDPEAKRALDVLGVNALTAVEIAYVPRGKRLVTSLVVEMPEAAKRGGLLKGLADTTAYDPAMLKFVPRDATLFWLGSVDFPWLWDEVWATLARADGRAAADARKTIAELELKAGVKFRDGFLAPLGKGSLAVSWNDGLWVSRSVIVQRLRDGQALEKAIAQLVARLDLLLMDLPNVGAVRCDLKTFKYRGTTCRYLWMTGTPVLLLPGWAPCYANLGDVFVFAPNPLHLKAYLDFLADKAPTILDNAEFQRLAALVPRGATSISYGAWPDTVEAIYNTLAPIAMLAQLAPDFKPALDLANLPSSRVIRRYSRGSIAYTTFQNGRFRAEVQGDGLDLLSPHAVPVAATAIVAGMALPALASARTEARLIRNRNNLNMIAKCCAVYLNEHGDNRWYPSGLAELVDKKIIPKEVLVSPLDPDPPKLPNGVPCSYVSVFDKYPDRVFQDDFPPNAVMAWDRKPFVPGKRSLLFFDSHVEVWVDEEKFEAEMKRLDELVKKLTRKLKPGEVRPQQKARPRPGPAKGEF